MFLDVTWLEIPKLFISSTMDENTKTDRESIIEDLKKENYDIIEFQCYNFPYDNSHGGGVSVIHILLLLR